MPVHRLRRWPNIKPAPGQHRHASQLWFKPGAKSMFGNRAVLQWAYSHPKPLPELRSQRLGLGYITLEILRLFEKKRESKGVKPNHPK